MSTFMANKANIERKWYILDAAGKPEPAHSGPLAVPPAAPAFPGPGRIFWIVSS